MTTTTTSPPDDQVGEHRLFVPPDGWNGRIVCACIKGGTGKSTTAVHLACALCRSGRTLLVDTDADSQTAIRWAGSYTDRTGHDFPPTVIQYTQKQLVRSVDRYAADGGYRHVVIDVGGKGDAMFYQAIRWAAMREEADEQPGMLFIPVRPSPLELECVVPTMEAALQAADEVGGRVYPVILLVQTPRERNNAVLVRQTREAFADAGLPLLDADVPMLNVYLTAKGTAPADTGHYEEVLREVVSA